MAFTLDTPGSGRVGLPREDWVACLGEEVELVAAALVVNGGHLAKVLGQRPGRHFPRIWLRRSFVWLYTMARCCGEVLEQLFVPPRLNFFVIPQCRGEDGEPEDAEEPRVHGCGYLLLVLIHADVAHAARQGRTSVLLLDVLPPDESTEHVCRW